ncbi:hypothetical protein VHUM_02931 [Vanrija humicola]|uniref:Uncharacterized protein n=1 Tax=Vanrija humicola TaxID=5417 RepID=A0A7D8Z2X0_VANHU|nr:hypothetical protein VHUM_02931 [Vanrija humicola]
MPLQILSHRRHKSSNNTPDSHSAPQSPSIVVSDNSTPVQGILRQPSAPSVADSDLTGSSTSASAFGRASLRTNGHSFGRTETVDSRWSVDDRDSSSTPSTSVSSFGGMCPLPESDGEKLIPFFSMTVSSTSTLSFIGLPTRFRPLVLDTIRRAWKRGVKNSGPVEYQADLMKYHKSKGCDGGVWEVTMKDSCWMPRSEDKVSSKRIILYLLAEFSRIGSRVRLRYSADPPDSGKDTLTFSRAEPDADPVFMGVAFYSSDRIWIIDAEADVGQALEEGIKAHWVDGVRDARVRERHCRELRLRGSPWVSHNTMGLISARSIILSIMKNITHTSRGYTFVGSVNLADLDEGEMPLLIFRKLTTVERRSGLFGWGDPNAEVPAFQPISKAAAASMAK